MVEASSNLEREVPPRYARFAGITTLTCAPIAAGGRWLGVIFADRGGGRFELTERGARDDAHAGPSRGAGGERRAGAPASTSVPASSSERISLIREIHER